MINLIGFLGSILLSLSALPQVIASFRRGNSDGISVGMLWFWLIGVLCMFIYNLFKYQDTLICVNYAFNFIFVGIIVYFKYCPRRVI